MLWEHYCRTRILLLFINCYMLFLHTELKGCDFVRFIIPKGCKLIDALNSLTDFLKTNYPDYPFAASNVNIYFNVSGKNVLPEGENNREFFMDKNGQFVDNDKILISEGFRDTFWRIDSFIKDYSSKVAFLQEKLAIKEKCRKEELVRYPNDGNRAEIWDEQIELAKDEIREAFFLENLATQIKEMRNSNNFIRYSRVVTFAGKGMSKDKYFKDVIAVVEFNGLEGFRFKSCYFVNGKNEFFTGKFDKERNKNKIF